MSLFRMDPGPCPVCGAPHTTCTAPSTASMQTLQLPNRDAAIAAAAAAVAPISAPPAPPLATNEFTSATYRRALHGKGRK